MTCPLVSVIVPAYNNARTIAETLESALGQTYPRREIIVVDDGSTDDTPDRIEPYRSSIQFVRQANQGVGAARNAGLGRASGEYVAFLDADDLWDPRTLEVQVEVAGRHPESGLVVCDGVEFDGGRIVSPSLVEGAPARLLDGSPDGEVTGRFYREIIEHNPICCPAQGLTPRAVVHRIGLMMEPRQGAHDWDYTLRIALHYPITFHRQKLVRWRYSPSGLSGPRELRAFNWGLEAIPVLQRHLGLCPTDHRELIRRTLRARIRSEARRAYDHGRRHDMAFARSYLRQLSRLAPGNPAPLLLRVALWMPDPVVQTFFRLRRLLD